MQITIGQVSSSFTPWRPEQGCVFQSLFAFDAETTLIDTERDWLTPAFVLAAVYDGRQGFFLRRDHLAPFFDAHRDIPFVLHNAPFDLAVIHAVAPALDIYGWVDRHQVWDTLLLHRLLTLGTVGHTARGSGQSTLETCATQYLGVELSKTVQDSVGLDVRLSYSKWLNRPPHEIEAVYLDYLGKDVLATFWIFHEVIRRLHELLLNSNQVWGHVSVDWLSSQVNRFGYQTHHIQIQAAIVLREIKANGLWIDQGQREQHAAQLSEVANECRTELRGCGYLPGQPGSGKALQEILRRLERNHPEFQFPKTATGKFVTKQEVLEDLATVEPFITALLQYKSIEKLQSTFLNKMAKPCVHPSFDPLMVSGRTSSFGEINAQNLPRDDRIRSCFTASPGHVLIDADYATVEMATLAQSVLSQFGLPSAMAAAINAGQDLHMLVAACVTGKTEAEVSRDERQKAKPINFGKPGGMGNGGLQRYAKASYGVDLAESEVEALTRAWFALFPEMEHFLQHDGNLGESIAQFFGLTPRSFYEQSGNRRFLDHPDNYGREEMPHAIMGWMFRKVLHEAGPKTRRGDDYGTDFIEYCWHRAQSCIDLLNESSRNDIGLRQPSPKLAWDIQRRVDRHSCFTLSGRLRANASFCARHNTIFQGLAADGAKLALWRLWRAGYRIVNFIHDEVLIEVPEDSDLGQHAETIRQIMIDGMRQVVPDVRIEVEYAACRRWYKAAVAVRDRDGRLLAWEPTGSPALDEPQTTTSSSGDEFNCPELPPGRIGVRRHSSAVRLKSLNRNVAAQ